VSPADPRTLVRRLREVFDLFEAGLSMKRAQLRRDRPDATEQEIELALRTWLATREGAEHGDAPGRVRRIDPGAA
jgi:Rv0078B-related antitoxin